MKGTSLEILVTSHVKLIDLSRHYDFVSSALPQIMHALF